MNSANQQTREYDRVAEQIGEAAGNLMGHLGSNGARLVGGVISDAIQVSRRWHELSFSVLLTSLKTAAQTVKVTLTKNVDVDVDEPSMSMSTSTSTSRKRLHPQP